MEISLEGLLIFCGALVAAGAISGEIRDTSTVGSKDFEPYEGSDRQLQDIAEQDLENSDD